MVDRPGSRPRNPKIDLGRAGTNSVNDRAHADEETLQEEHRHLRKRVVQLRTENDALKDKLRKGDLVALDQDKRLQALLASAQGGPGLPGEALDQLREDLQALLQFRRKAYDCRQLIEEKEVKFEAIACELQTTRVFDMEAQVAEAKKRARELVDCNYSNRTPCFVESQQMKHDAGNLLEDIFSFESKVSKCQREMVGLQDIYGKKESDIRYCDEQIQNLVKDLDEKEKMKRSNEEETNTTFASMEEMNYKLNELQREHVRMKEARKLQKTSEAAKDSMQRMPNGASISKKLFEAGFEPASPDSRIADLLRRFHRACTTLQLSALEILVSADDDHDGFISSFELRLALSKAKVVPSNPADVDALVNMLGHNGLVGILDLFFASTLQPACSTPSDEEIRIAADALAWACRRQHITEEIVRRSIADKLVHSDANLESEFASFCENLGVRQKSAQNLGRVLQSKGERIARWLPSWRCPSYKAAADVLGRFLKNVIEHSTKMRPVLEQGPLQLDQFIKKIVENLGAQWSRETLEIVALIAEIAPDSQDVRPIVDGSRLARAIEPRGFLHEFPKEYELCHLETRNSIEKLAPTVANGVGTSPIVHKPAQVSASAPLPPPAMTLADHPSHINHKPAQVSASAPLPPPAMTLADHPSHINHQPAQVSATFSAEQSRTSPIFHKPAQVSASAPLPPPAMTLADHPSHIVHQPAQVSAPFATEQSSHVVHQPSHVSGPSSEKSVDVAGNYDEENYDSENFDDEDFEDESVEDD